MRTELETIATIEKYLLGVLSEGENLVFEMRMETDPNFKNEVDLQAQLVQSLERISIQQSIQNAQKTYQFWKFLKLVGFVMIPIVIALLTWYFWNASAEGTHESGTIPTQVEQPTSQKSTVVTEKEITIDPDTILKKKPKKNVQKTTTVLVAQSISSEPLERIPTEIFTISIEKDTIVETQNGIVFLIPKGAFVDTNQNVVNENIQLKIKEVVTAETIMTSGLSTLHNGKPLETGGMFFIEASKDGAPLEIHPEKGITADIPTQNYKEDMQLFDGEVAADGTINWVKPKPLSKALIPQDILSLDFYPPNYLDSLAFRRYDTTNKQFTDSLYYSFSAVSKKEEYNQTIGKYFDKELNRRSIRSQVDTISSLQKDTVKIDDLLTSSKEVFLGLDPLKVKTIWNERYQNTFIATKAFEARLQAIHENCYNANTILDIYLQNLAQDLYVSDSIAAYSTGVETINTQFYDFYQQRLTNVANVDAAVSKLNQYYVAQQKVYRLALANTQRKVDSMLNADKKYQAFSKQQVANLYANELKITTNKVMNDLNIPMPRTINTAINTRRTQVNEDNTIVKIIRKEKNTRRYRTTIRTTGWKNIDRIIDEEVILSLSERTNTSIQIREKTSTIRFTEYQVTIENSTSFDQLFVYLIPKELNSFIQLNSENNRFTYALNQLLKYDVYCIAYKNEVPFFYSKSIKNASDEIVLKKITESALREKLALLQGQNSSLKTEVSYQTFQRKNKKTIQKYRKLTQLKKALELVVFPCQKFKPALPKKKEVRTLNAIFDTIIRVEAVPDDGQ